MTGRNLTDAEPASQVEEFRELNDDEIAEVAGGIEVSGGAFGYYAILSVDGNGWGYAFASGSGAWAGGGTW